VAVQKAAVWVVMWGAVQRAMVAGDEAVVGRWEASLVKEEREVVSLAEDTLAAAALAEEGKKAVLVGMTAVDEEAPMVVFRVVAVEKAASLVAGALVVASTVAAASMAALAAGV
jgi:hypothetical protein